MPTYNVRRCAPCSLDWPDLKAYNLCPRCQKCSVAATTPTRPDHIKAAHDAARHERVREFDAAHDAKADIARADWDAAMQQLFDAAPSIPDPPRCDDLPALPTNYGLAGGSTFPPTNPQDPRWWNPNA